MYFSSTNLHARLVQRCRGVGVGSLSNPKAQVGGSSKVPIKRLLTAESHRATRSHRIQAQAACQPLLRTLGISPWKGAPTSARKDRVKSSSILSLCCLRKAQSICLTNTSTSISSTKPSPARTSRARTRMCWELVSDRLTDELISLSNKIDIACFPVK